MRSSQHCLAFWRFGVFIVLALIGGALEASPKKDFSHWRQKYDVLEGQAAVQFLVGNSLLSPDFSGGNYIDYLIDDSTGMWSHQGSLSCSIYPRKFRGSENCGNQSLSAASGEHCMPFYVLALKSAKMRAPKTGGFIGYYMIGQIKNDESLLTDSDRNRSLVKGLKELSHAIIKGNATECPLMKSEAAAQAVELAATDPSVDVEKGPLTQDQSGSNGALVKKILVGNSVVWPKPANYDCGTTDYFSPNGLIYSVACDSPSYLPRLSPRQSFSLKMLHWKMIGERFCVEDPENEGHFRSCDPIYLSAVLVPASNGQGQVKQVRATFIDHASVGPLEPEVKRTSGLVMKGNPAGFLVK